MSSMFLRRSGAATRRTYAGPDDFNYSPSSPVVGETVTFTVIGPRAGVTYTWDRTADGVADYTGNSFEYAYAGEGNKQVDLYANGVLVATKTIAVAPVSGGGGGGSGTGPIHTHRLLVNPGGTDTSDNDGNHRDFCYAWFRRQFAYDHGGIDSIVWAGGHLYEGRELWFLWSMRPGTGIYPGRMLNFHNHPAFGGWVPSGGGPDSAFCIDWNGTQQFTGYEGNGTSTPVDGMFLHMEHNGAVRGFKKKGLYSNSQMQAFAASQTWLDFVAHVHIHESTGSVTVWAQGNSTPIIDVNPAGIIWPNQTGFLMYEGMYGGSQWLPGQQSHSFQPMRFGRTLAEALAVGTTYPIIETAIAGSSSSYGGSPMYTHSVLTPRDASEFRLPVVLGGSG